MNDKESSNSLIKIEDALGLGKATAKLVDVIAKGTGIIYKPRAIRKEADAEAYRIRKIAEAEADKIRITALAEADKDKMLAIADMEIEERAKARIKYQEIKRQENIERISEAAEEHLNEEISDENVDDDWIAQFFSTAKDVSNEMMQDVWGRVLAGEINKPGSYRLRSLECLKVLSQEEAEIFQRACYLAIFKTFIIKLSKQPDLKQFGLSFP